MLRVRGGGARDHLRDALVVAEELDHRAPDAVVEARPQGPQRREVREGHRALRVRGEDARDQGVEDRLGEAPPLLDARQGGLHLGRAQRDRLVHRPRRLAPGGLEEGGHVALHAHVVRQAARGVHHRRRREVVPVGLAVLAVAPEEHPRGATLGHGLAQVGHRRHVGRGARQQPQVLAEDLAGGVAGLAEEGGVRERDLVLGRARVEEGHPEGRRLDGALEEAQPPLFLAAHEENPRAVAQEGGVERLRERLVGARGERDLDRPLGAEAEHEDRGLVDVGEGADAGAHREAVHDREKRVQHHEVEVEAPGQGEGLDAVRRVDDLDRGAVQDASQQVAGGRVAARDQDRGARRGRTSGPGGGFTGAGGRLTSRAGFAASRRSSRAPACAG